MPNRQLPGQQSSPVLTGMVERVPCPHCGKTNDFRHLQEQQLLDTGSTVTCDARDAKGAIIGCGKLMQVAAVRQVLVVAVRAVAGQPSGPSGGTAAPARTIGGRALRKLIGGR
jgi:hypothetical protein